MSNPGQSDTSGGQHALVSAGASMPAMPVIRDREKYLGSPFLLVDGPSRMIGWQWSSPGKGDPQFVIAARSAMGGLKIIERFPLTEEGWLSAWQSLSRDPKAAHKAAAKLAQRIADDAALEVQQSGRDAQPMLIVTTNEVPGHRITDVHGAVFGLVVRAGNYLSNLGASLRTIAGGEAAGYTRLLTDSRNQAVERMWREARERGANAVVAMRFDCNEIGDMSEVVAYGTAVTVEAAGPNGPTML